MSRNVNDPYMSHFNKVSDFEGPRKFVCKYNDDISFTLSRLSFTQTKNGVIARVTNPEEDKKIKKEMRSHVNYCTAEVETHYQNQQETAAMEAN